MWKVCWAIKLFANIDFPFKYCYSMILKFFELLWSITKYDAWMICLHKNSCCALRAAYFEIQINKENQNEIINHLDLLSSLLNLG